MISKPKAFLFYGLSGSGKGTQAKLLIDYLKKIDPERDTIYIETGARLREFVNDNAGFTKNKVKEVLDVGGLLPEFIPIWLWSHLMVRACTGKEHIVLDGVSRRQHESPIISGALKFYGFETLTIFFIKVSRDWARERLHRRGRYDDDDAEINRRFDWYEKNTMPAMDYFKTKDHVTFVEIDGEQSVEKVHEDILKNSAL